MRCVCECNEHTHLLIINSKEKKEERRNEMTERHPSFYY